ADVQAGTVPVVGARWPPLRGPDGDGRRPHERRRKRAEARDDPPTVAHTLRDRRLVRGRSIACDRWRRQPQPQPPLRRRRERPWTPEAPVTQGRRFVSPPQPGVKEAIRKRPATRWLAALLVVLALAAHAGA